MNREEIENRIEACEIKANGYREVGNIKLADKYDNEKYKWEKLLSDLNLLNERKIAELLEYKKGYFNLEQENKELHNKIEKAIEYINNTDWYLPQWECRDKQPDKNILLEILKDSDVNE